MPVVERRVVAEAGDPRKTGLWCVKDRVHTIVKFDEPWIRKALQWENFNNPKNLAVATYDRSKSKNPKRFKPKNGRYPKLVTLFDFKGIYDDHHAEENDPTIIKRAEKDLFVKLNEGDQWALARLSDMWFPEPQQALTQSKQGEMGSCWLLAALSGSLLGWNRLSSPEVAVTVDKCAAGAPFQEDELDKKREDVGLVNWYGKQLDLERRFNWPLGSLDKGWSFDRWKIARQDLNPGSDINELKEAFKRLRPFVPDSAFLQPRWPCFLESRIGVYDVTLFHTGPDLVGRWVTVRVDDRVPARIVENPTQLEADPAEVFYGKRISNGMCSAMEPRWSTGSFGVELLTKAASVLAIPNHGKPGYDWLYGGQAHEGVRMLSGADRYIVYAPVSIMYAEECRKCVQIVRARVRAPHYYV